MTPIHTALRRMWQYSAPAASRRHDIDLHPLEDRVLDLIDAGANVHARDGRDNTAIYYLADGFLDAFHGGQRRRQLFYMLLDKHQKDNHERERRDFWNNAPDMQSVDEELFGKFDEQGTNWMVRDKFERTLLHSVVQTMAWGPRVLWRRKYLVQKGVDPMARDFEGKTARDLAPERQDWAALKFLEEAEQAAAHGKA